MFDVERPYFGDRPGHAAGLLEEHVFAEFEI